LIASDRRQKIPLIASVENAPFPSNRNMDAEGIAANRQDAAQFPKRPLRQSPRQVCCGQMLNFIPSPAIHSGSGARKVHWRMQIQLNNSHRAHTENTGFCKSAICPHQVTTSKYKQPKRPSICSCAQIIADIGSSSRFVDIRLCFFPGITVTTTRSNPALSQSDFNPSAWPGISLATVRMLNPRYTTKQGV